MLSKVYEWSRVTHPTLDDEYVTKRTEIIQSLTEALQEDVPLLIEATCFAASGSTLLLTQVSKLVTTLVAAIREKQPAFPVALTENNFDLRVICALVVGEVVDRAAKASPPLSGVSELIACIISCGLLHRPVAAPQHLRTMLAELASACGAAARRAADSRRLRYPIGKFVSEIKEAPDVPAFWKEAAVKFGHMAHAIESNQRNDREELDTLWWAFNGLSRETGQPFADMPLGEVALRGASELTQLVKTPPLPNTKVLLRRAMAAGRGTDALGERPLRELIAECDLSAAASFLGDKPTDELIRSNPIVFPVSWMCQRLKESGTLPAPDFKKATGWDTQSKISADKVAYQAFNEKIALKLYADSAAG